MRVSFSLGFFFLGCLQIGAARAETGGEGWLRYQRLRTTPDLPQQVVRLGDSAVLRSAQLEMIRGLQGMQGRTPAAAANLTDADAIVLGTVAVVKSALPEFAATSEMSEESSVLITRR